MTSRRPPIATPDGRYIVVQGRLWRTSNPQLSQALRQNLVDELMAARRAVRDALAIDDEAALGAARARVQGAKEALGERGEVWWTDGAPDLNRRLLRHTPYASWWESEHGGLPTDGSAPR